MSHQSISPGVEIKHSAVSDLLPEAASALRLAHDLLLSAILSERCLAPLSDAWHWILINTENPCSPGEAIKITSIRLLSRQDDTLWQQADILEKERARIVEIVTEGLRAQSFRGEASDRGLISIKSRGSDLSAHARLQLKTLGLKCETSAF